MQPLAAYYLFVLNEDARQSLAPTEVPVRPAEPLASTRVRTASRRSSGPSAAPPRAA
jgi:hypothetical protein